MKREFSMNLQPFPINLTLRQLRAFVAVATLRGFTAAAKELHLTQSSLSSLVKELEDVLGVRLLDRTTREVSLTQPGVEFLPLACRVLDDLHKAVGQMTDLKYQRRGMVRLAALELLSCTVLPRALAAYRRSFPHLEVSLFDCVIEQVLAKVASGEVDLGIGPEPCALDPEIERRLLLQAPFQLVCRHDHRLARQRKAIWADLRGECFITMIRNFRTQIATERAGWPCDLVIEPTYQVSLLTTALGMTSAGFGVTVCPSYGLPLVRGLDLVMLPLEQPVITADIFIFTRRGRALPPASARLIDFLIDFIGKESFHSPSAVANRMTPEVAEHCSL